MHFWVRFWVVTLSLVVGIGALLFLSLSFVFPDVPTFQVGPAGRLAAVLVGVGAMGIVALSAATAGEIVTENPGQRGRGN